jgi:hypothetical protein
MLEGVKGHKCSGVYKGVPFTGIAQYAGVSNDETDYHVTFDSPLDIGKTGTTKTGKVLKILFKLAYFKRSEIQFV